MPVLLLVGTVVALYLLGWFTKPVEWQHATGWDRIPPAERPLPAPMSAGPVNADPGPRIHWLGHSGFLVHWNGVSVLLDPNTDTRCTVSKRIMEQPLSIGLIDPVDAVLISHAHFDHLNLATIRKVRALETIILPAGSEGYCAEFTGSRTSVTPLRVGERHEIKGLEIIAVPAKHNGNRLHPWSSRYTAQGYILRSEGTTLYYAGDTAFDNDFNGIREAYQPDLAILPIGAYAPRIPLQIHHMSPEDAVRAAGILGVGTVIPCHFGTFRLSLDRPDSALPRFAAAAAKAEVNWEMPKLLLHAEQISPATRLARSSVTPGSEE